jgi:hypothetical protein
MCDKCRKNGGIIEDKKPRRTIDSPARYVAPKPYCGACRSASRSWIPIDDNIAWIRDASLSKFWAKFGTEAWNRDELAKYLKLYGNN